MTTTRVYKTDSWWVDTGVRFFHVTLKGGCYTARCGDIKGKGATLRAAVQVAAIRAARPRKVDYDLPF